MSRHEAQEEGDLINLDSFSDIMTNVVAILIILIMVGISGGGAAITHFFLKNRVVREAEIDEQRKAVYVEVSGGDLTVIPTAAVAEAIRRESGTRPLVATALETTTYVVTVDELDGVRFARKSAADIPAEISAISGEQSEFANALATLDPQHHWFFFIVESDSFDEFRRARSMAEERGFSVGWRPRRELAPEGAIAFTASGMIPKLQQ